jgi:small subunit ribosomal protein S18
MARSRPRPGGGRSRRKKRTRGRESNRCRFGNDPSNVDYKDIAMLTKLTTQQGKLFSRKRSGASARCQRALALAVKRARFLGLLPYVG